MFKITKHEKVLIVNDLTRVELETISAASTIFSRVFNVSCITMRMNNSFHNTTIRAAIDSLEEKGMFFIFKQENRRLIIRFTERGRSICGLVKDKIKVSNHVDVMQPSLF